MRASYDVIVVGSGYGGGVAACRLSRAGLKVAVLERGREWRIGEFPKTIAELGRAFRASGARIGMGPKLALFDYRVNEDVDVLVGCGLGGTSLINANVCLKPDRRVFEDPVWPSEIRADGMLEEGFARARSVLRPAPTPDDIDLQKLAALQRSAVALGTSSSRVPLHITFQQQRNYANVVQPACSQCGDCCGGCNVGAKSTVLLTYLADAAQHGAHIITGCEVRAVLPIMDGRWAVHWRPRDAKDESDDGTTTRQVLAPVIVLAAGTLGSTEILLRSRAMGLALSPRLGERFTANGDALAVAYNGEVPVNNIGVGHPPRANVQAVGPAVAGLIDLRGRGRLEDDVAIVEAALPSAMAGLVPSMLAGGNLPFGQDFDKGFGDEIGEALRSFESLVTGAYRGAAHNTQTLLGVGHDEGNGALVLENDALRIRWPGAGAQRVYQRIDEVFATASKAIGASLLKNPMSLPGLGGKITTVHPLGGCAMGETRKSGVVDHKCRVFSGDPVMGDRDVHEGLYVCDGSVMPRSLGVHPLFTITALAERAMVHFAADRQLTIDLGESRTGPGIEIRPVGASEGGGFLAWLRRLFGRGIQQRSERA